MQFLKQKYPDKQTINLALRETDAISFRNQMIAFGIFIICLGLFVKFAVIGRLEAVEQAKRTYLETEQYIQILEERSKEYNEVKKLYNKLNETFLSEAEKKEIDRMEIINLIEACVMNLADIERMSITNNQVTVTIVDTTLGAVSEIVAALEKEDRIGYVTVFTAGTDTQNKQTGIVSADIMVQLRQEVEENE